MAAFSFSILFLFQDVNDVLTGWVNGDGLIDVVSEIVGADNFPAARFLNQRGELDRRIASHS